MKNITTIQFIIVFILIFHGCKNEIDEAYELKNLDLKDKALQSLNKIIENDPKDSEAYFALANIYAETGKISEAIVNYNNALKINPDNDRYFMHYILNKMRFTPEQNLKILEDELLQRLKNSSDKKLLYMLLSKLYSVEYEKNYFETISKLLNIKELNNWKFIYNSPKTKNMEGKYFTIISDSVQYFDKVSKKNVGYQGNGEIIPCLKLTSDTLFFLDPVQYILTTHLAWKPINIYDNETHPTRQNELKINNPDLLYSEPKAAYFYKARNGAHREVRDDYISSTIEDFEPGTLRPTNKKEVFQYKYNLFTGIEYHWIGVEYKKRKYLERFIPLSNEILVFKDKNSSSKYSSAKNYFPDSKLLNKIFKANYIAENMTTDLINLSINLSYIKTEFNKNEFIEHYKFGENELIFTDGFLTSITEGNLK